MTQSSSSPFKPVSVKHDYRFLTLLQRVNQLKNCSGFIQELESLASSNPNLQNSVLKNRKSFEAGVLPVDDTIPEAQDSLERANLSYLCRIFSLLGFSDNISDTLTCRIDDESLLTTPFGLLWNNLQASKLLKVHKNGQSVDEDEEYGYNAIFHEINSSILFSLTQFRFSAFLCSPIFVSGLMNKCLLSSSFADEISVYQKNGLGALNLNPKKILAAMSQKKRILLVKGVGMIVCSETAEDLLVCVKNLFHLCQKSHNSAVEKMKDYSFGDWKDLLKMLSLKPSNSHINCHFDVKISPIIFSGEKCQKNSISQKENPNRFVPYETNLDDYWKIYGKIKEPKTNSVAQNLPEPNMNNHDSKEKKNNKKLSSKFSFKWPFNRDVK